jgi:hypothetical protein
MVIRQAGQKSHKKADSILAGGRHLSRPNVFKLQGWRRETPRNLGATEAGMASIIGRNFMPYASGRGRRTKYWLA